MSDYPPEQQESEYLHTALLEYQRDVESLTIELTSARARIAELERELAKLSDPVAVHINMLRGTIATPSVELMEHIWQRSPTATPLDRPDKPGWWWEWDHIARSWMPWYVADPENSTKSKWLPATPPPVPKENPT